MFFFFFLKLSNEQCFFKPALSIDLLIEFTDYVKLLFLLYKYKVLQGAESSKEKNGCLLIYGLN